MPVTYSNASLGFMTDSTIKGRRLDLRQVPGTYSHGPSNSQQLKKAKKQMFGAQSIHSLL